MKVALSCNLPLSISLFVLLWKWYQYCKQRLHVIVQCSAVIVLIAAKCPVRFLNTGYEHYSPNKQLTALYAASEWRGKQEAINHVPLVQVNNYQTLHPLLNPIAQTNTLIRMGVDYIATLVWRLNLGYPSQKKHILKPVAAITLYRATKCIL